MADTPNNIVKLLTAALGSAQDLENVLQQVFTEFTIDTAVGAQLDVIGSIVGQARNGLVDDDYRRYCKARIVANRSNGVTEDLIKIMSLIVNDSTAQYRVQENGPATVVARIEGSLVSASLGGIVFSFLKTAVSGGVRIKIQWNQDSPFFRFDTGPGFDVGHLANAFGN